MEHVTGSIPLPQEIKISFTRPLHMSLGKIQCMRDIVDFIKANFSDAELDYKEYMWCIVLTRPYMILGATLIGVGTHNNVAISHKEVVQIALMSHAKAVILVHNHPSGGLEFSPSDIHVTNRVKEALNLIEVDLLDHLIITSEGFVSGAIEGIV